MNVVGLEVGDIEADSIPISAVLLLKVLNPDGGMSMVVRYTDNLPTWEAVGMLHAAEAVETAGLVDAFRPD